MYSKLNYFDTQPDYITIRAECTDFMVFLGDFNISVAEILAILRINFDYTFSLLGVRAGFAFQSFANYWASTSSRMTLAKRFSLQSLRQKPIKFENTSFMS